MKDLSDFNVDIGTIFDEVENTRNIDVRDPSEEPWGNPERDTASQRKAWEVYWRHDSPRIALIGGKGSGKTFWGSRFSALNAQRFPESLGCLISNTYTQASDNGQPLFLDACEQLDLKVEFFEKKKIRGRKFSSVLVIDLDNRGWDHGKCSYLLLRSFESVHKLEGIELDYLWVEEVQDADREDFKVAVSRVRGQRGDRSIFIAGMPRDEFHWMYSTLPNIGFIEEDNYNPAEHEGILMEPALTENQQNLPEDYIENLYSLYDSVKAEWYIHGNRTSLSTNKILYTYSDHLHRTGPMSRMLSNYDQNQDLVFSFDFNVSPMSVSVWQEKRWNDDWRKLTIESNEYRLYDSDGSYETFEDPNDFAESERTVLVQVDEYEVWQGGTSGVCEKIVEDYRDHNALVIALGDATGNRKDTRSSKTDWTIIRRSFNRTFNQLRVIQGLQQSYNYKKGETKYSNPDRKDTFNVCNTLLRDANNTVKVCFMPESNYESGGCAKSCAMAKTRPDGTIDTSEERKEGRHVARLHFFDTFRYVCWWWGGGESAITPEEDQQEQVSAMRSAEFDHGTDFDGLM